MGPRARSALAEVLVGVGATLLYGAYAIARRGGDWTSDLAPFRSSSVLYAAPVVLPLTLFLFERAHAGLTGGRAPLLVDAGVVALAASRMWIPVPLVSGHALFLTYGLWTTRRAHTRVALAVVLAGTAIVKVFVWHDPSLVGGAVVATLAALARRRLRAREVSSGPMVEPTLRPVGVIRSELASRKGAPRQGDEGAPDAWLEIEPWAADALLGLAVGDALVVITWLHQGRREVLQVHPRSDPQNPLAGVFATRSPDRPNPLGLHPVSIRSIEGLRLRIGPIEAIDGTPVVDLKPVLCAQSPTPRSQ